MWWILLRVRDNDGKWPVVLKIEADNQTAVDLNNALDHRTKARMLRPGGPEGWIITEGVAIGFWMTLKGEKSIPQIDG